MSLHRRILLSPYANGPDVPCSSPLPDIGPPVLSATRRLSNAAIASVSAAAAAAFLAIVYYSVLHRRRRRRRGGRDFPAVSVGGDDAASDSDGREALDGYHVWNIRTVGLDDSAITSIGSYAYLPGGGNLTADCPVCLGQFQGEEMVRLLPKCGHVFHVPCIDTWLEAHVTCPICRAYVLSPEVDPGRIPAGLEEEGEGESETRVRVLADPDAPPEAEAAAEIPMGPSATAEREREERIGEEQKEDNLGEREIGGVSSSSGSGRGFFGKVGRCRSSSVIPL